MSILLGPIKFEKILFFLKINKKKREKLKKNQNFSFFIGLLEIGLDVLNFILNYIIFQF